MNYLSTWDFESPQQHWVSTFLPLKNPRKGKGRGKAGRLLGRIHQQHGFYPTQALDMAESRLKMSSFKNVPGFAGSLAAIFYPSAIFWRILLGRCQGKGKAEAPKGGKSSGKGPMIPWVFHGFFRDVTIPDISQTCVFSCFNCSPLLGCVNQLFRRLEFRKTTKPKNWPRIPVDATGEDSHQKFRSLADPTT